MANTDAGCGAIAHCPDLVRRADDRGSQWIQSWTGRRVFPLDPLPDDIDVRDIAHALAHVNRFTGHTKYGYSVAQHSVLASAHAPPEAKMAARLHRVEVPDGRPAWTLFAHGRRVGGFGFWCPGVGFVGWRPGIGKPGGCDGTATNHGGADGL